jgi:hypothetical protein
MGFWTSCKFYRPRTPPLIRCADLANFVERLSQLNIAGGKYFYGAKVAFGTAIDQDDRPSSSFEPIEPSGIIHQSRDIEWGWGAKYESLAELTAALREAPDKPIYRAFVSLGGVATPVYEALSRPPVPENDQYLSLDGLSLEIDRIEIYDHDQGASIHCGWISVNIGGQGYPYPWTKREVLQRLETEPHVVALAELCRSTWPVPNEPLPPQYVELRRKLQNFWLYDDLAKPWDWYWGVDAIGS